MFAAALFGGVTAKGLSVLVCVVDAGFLCITPDEAMGRWFDAPQLFFPLKMLQASVVYGALLDEERERMVGIIRDFSSH